MTDYPRSTMNRRRFASGAAAAFAGVAIVRAPAARGAVQFQSRLSAAARSPQHIRMVEAAARILTSTNGRLQLQLFPNSELGSDDSSVAQLRSGAMEMYIGSDGVLSTIVMDAAIEGVGFAFKSQPQALGAIDGPLGDLVRKQMVARGSTVCEVLGERIPANRHQHETDQDRRRPRRPQSAHAGASCMSICSRRSERRRHRSMSPTSIRRCKRR